MHLEVLSRKPKGKAKDLQILCVHGICVGAWIWDEHFLPYFAEHGYAAHAVSLRGHAGSEGKDGLLTWTLADYAADVDRIFARLRKDGPVVVVGHSLGGAVVQDWLRLGGIAKAKGAALLASVPPWGLTYSALRMGASYPQLFHEIGRMLMMGSDLINEKVMVRSLFSKDVSEDILEKFNDKIGDESMVASSEVQGLRPFAPPPWADKPPIFIGGALDDRFIPPEEVRRTAAYYGVNPVMVNKLAHSVMVDTNWKRMADPMLEWLSTLS